MASLVLSGLALGAIYCVAALGFVLVHSATGVINFAHGDLVVLAGLGAAAVASASGMPSVAILVVVAVAMVPIGLILDRWVFRPLTKEGFGFSSSFTAGIALSIIIASSLLLILGPAPRRLNPLVTGKLSVFGLTVPTENVVVISVVGLLVLFQWWLFNRTNLGVGLRATAQSKMTAQLMGIRVGWMTALTFGLAAAYAGVGGVLLAPEIFLNQDTGPSLMLKIYIAVVIGGFGSLAGAVVGGLALGVAETLTAAYISSGYANAIVYGLLFVLLLVRPQGIFGKVRVRV